MKVNRQLLLVALRLAIAEGSLEYLRDTSKPIIGKSYAESIRPFLLHVLNF